MKSLRLNQKKIISCLSKAGSLLFFLDYDGTLAPIARRPELALMPDTTKRVLKLLVKSRRAKVFIISGRVLKDVMRLVGVQGIFYAGSHGLESENKRTIKELAGLKGVVSVIKQVETALVEKLSGIIPIELVDIENKGFILALHYRRAGKRYMGLINKAFYSAARPYLESGTMIVAKNKKVLELQPSIHWNKGMYCLHMLKKFKGRENTVLPVYIGDDKTDETAFKALKDKGITIFVRGERKTSHAEYYLDSTSEVEKFLKLVAVNI